MSGLLLSTKFQKPKIRLNSVRRQHLLTRLQHGSSYKLILISAPAGYGKTTLVCEWLATCGCPSAWVSLDNQDNDPTRFWAYISAALQSALSSVGKALTESLIRYNSPINEWLITDLINEIDTLQHPLVLVLDDYHLIESQAVHEGILFLLEHAPAYLQLVITTRADPPLPLARLRARSEMLEVRQADLCFSTKEAAEFLNHTMGLNISSEDAARLTVRTEGWIVGLQMAAVSMQGWWETEGSQGVSHFIESFTGSHRFILDYLMEEVVNQQPQGMQDFLQMTSILEQLTVDLCDAITDRQDSQIMLEAVERANLFLIPLDDERRWYRYHRLFARLLREWLKQNQPGLVRELHQRASHWYSRNQMIPEAIGHALDSGNYLLVNELVSGDVLAMLEHAELNGVLRRFERIPASEMEAKPWLGVAYAWTKAYVNPSEELDLMLAKLESGFIVVEDAAEKKRLSSHLDAIRAYVAWMKGRAEQALSYASSSLENLPDDDWMARCHNLNIAGLAHQYLLDLNRAVQSFEAAITAGRKTGRPYETFHAYTNLAFANLMQVRLHRAFSLCQQVLNLADQKGELATQMPVLAYAFATLSQVQLEWNDVESALSNARKAVSQAEQWNQADTLHYALTCLAEAMCAAGDLDGAFEVNQRAMQLARNVSPWFFRISTFMEAKLNLAKGDVWAATSILEEIEPYIDVREQSRSFLIVKTAVILAQERFEEVVLTVEGPVCEMERQGRNWPLMELLPCLALALHAIGRKEEAQDVIGHCLTLAAPEGFVYTFVKRGEPMRKLLLEALERGIEMDYIQKLLSAFHIHEAGQMPETGIVLPTVSRPPICTLVEPLSRREMDVLKLLAQNYPDKQIAESLFIARETVHKHLKNIYEKLGVHRRTEAVTQARDLGLL